MTKAANPQHSADSGVNGQASSINPEEIAKFTAMADTWWDPNGPFRPLHKFNPIRISLLRQRLAAHFKRDPNAEQPFTGLRLLDIGCGGGLISEPMAELGFEVTGIDASTKNIAIASNHAQRSGTKVTYISTSPEQLAETTEPFDAILCLEVVEHVADLGLFLQAAAKPLKQDGFMALATLNRTLKSLALAKIGAEYILRWLPVGTHNWSDFVTPTELAKHLEAAGMYPPEMIGVSYTPILDKWSETRDLSVNYMAFATKR